MKLAWIKDEFNDEQDDGRLTENEREGHEKRIWN